MSGPDVLYRGRSGCDNQPVYLMRLRTFFHYGDHVCAIHESSEEQARTAAQFVAEGLRVGDRCLFAGMSPEAIDRFCEQLAAQGIDVDKARRDGALLLRTSDQAHLQDGHFDGERMLRLLSQTLEDALDAGYSGLRTCGDMTWLLDHAPGEHQVAEYEALVTELFRSVRAVGMCQYDRTQLPATVLDQALATHGAVVIDGAKTRNPFAKPAARQRAANPDDVEWKITELRERAAREQRLDSET